MTDDKVQTPQSGQAETKKPSRVEVLELRVEAVELEILSLEDKIKSLADNQTLAVLTGALQAIATSGGNGGKGKVKFGGNTGAKKVKDAKTGITYDSLSKCAKAVAVEFGEDPNNHFSWYKFGPQNPDRFEVITV